MRVLRRRGDCGSVAAMRMLARLRLVLLLGLGLSGFVLDGFVWQHAVAAEIPGVASRQRTEKKSFTDGEIVDGFRWGGTHRVTAKKEWPDWTPPSQMLKRRPDLPRHMQGGPENPLGARALYLGSSLYRIHGTNEPSTIGQNVSSGCIRMMNEDVIDLYERVRVGTRVIVS